MLTHLKALTAAKQDFAFESTLSSRSFAPFLLQLKAQGYQVAIYYFSLSNALLAVRRVKLRVAMGGHDALADTVRRRFGRSLNNFNSRYLPLADRWAVFDNSVNGKAILIATQEGDNLQTKKPSSRLQLQRLLTTC